MPLDMPSVEREWRDDFRQRLETMATVQALIQRDIAEIRLNAVKNQEIAELRQRIRILEDFKLRSIAMLIAIQSILAIAWMVFVQLKPR